jgi:hypothetical protein
MQEKDRFYESYTKTKDKKITVKINILKFFIRKRNFIIWVKYL